MGPRHATHTPANPWGRTRSRAQLPHFCVTASLLTRTPLVPQSSNTSTPPWPGFPSRTAPSPPAFAATLSLDNRTSSPQAHCWSWPCSRASPELYQHPLATILAITYAPTHCSSTAPLTGTCCSTNPFFLLPPPLSRRYPCNFSNTFLLLFLF